MESKKGNHANYNSIGIVYCYIIRTIKNPDTFNKSLEAVFAMFLKDRAAEVRQMGLSKLPDLIAQYRPEWAVGSFL